MTPHTRTDEPVPDTPTPGSTDVGTRTPGPTDADTPPPGSTDVGTLTPGSTDAGTPPPGPTGGDTLTLDTAGADTQPPDPTSEGPPTPGPTGGAALTPGPTGGRTRSQSPTDGGTPTPGMTDGATPTPPPTGANMQPLGPAGVGVHRPGPTDGATPPPTPTGGPTPIPTDGPPSPPRPTTGGTHTLGLLYPPAGRLRDYTTMQLAFVGGVAETAAAHGYDLLLAPAGDQDDPSFRRMVDERRVDGVIVMEIRREDDRVERLAEAGFPFVAIGRNHRADVSGWVDLDFAGLAGGCVQHLADLGHRRIAFVNRSEQLFNSGYGFARLGDEGYTETMKKLLLTPRTYLCGDDLASGERVVERILADDPATTSLVTLNEAALEGVYRGLTRNGRSVPRDFSVVGVAASPWAEQVNPPLTAADIPAKEMSRVAVDLMLRRLRSPDAPPRHVLLKPLITLRGSTGRCPSVPGSEPETDLPDFPDIDLDF